MLDKLKNDELAQCIEDIEAWFASDADIQLGYVLTDDPEDRQYSANTVYHRLMRIVTFERLYYGKDYKDVDDYLLRIGVGYPKEDVELLHKLMEEEDWHGGDREWI